MDMKKKLDATPSIVIKVVKVYSFLPITILKRHPSKQTNNLLVIPFDIDKEEKILSKRVGTLH